MRLFLLPISTRRSLIYCERVQQQLAPGEKLPITERLIIKAADTWAGWERAEKGWQKKLTVQGNRLLRRIPYEEWGLKSIPSATKKRLQDVDDGKIKFECLYPGAFMESGRVEGVLQALATGRQAFHRKGLWNSVVWMPVTLPFVLVPVIPNLPFFYLVFRAYSHYRALYGGKLLEHITGKGQIAIRDSPVMDELYAAGLLHPNRQASREAPPPTAQDVEKVSKLVESQTQGEQEEVMVLERWNGKLIAERFKLPEMEIEIERAVEQVEKAIAKHKAEVAAKKADAEAESAPLEAEKKQQGEKR